jgi:metallo-beta-lactamase class B
MTRTLVLLAGSILVVAASPAAASAQALDQEVRVSLAAGTSEEQQARDQLLGILASWDLSRWLFTREARIDARAIPHSHPVLTVNARYLSNDTAQVATFIHEQLHWFLVRHRAATDPAIAELERLFPDAPDGPPAGARDRHSTHLHLLIGLLEYEAIRSLFGDDAARRTISAWRHYPWVYEQVLARPDAIRRVLEAHGLDSPDARALVRPYSAEECRSCADWNTPHRAVHLFGNTYYIGTEGLASLLIASPTGHVLIDGGLPDTAPLILQSIRTLGFDPLDVQIILNSHAHYDHAGGIAALQLATGARVLVSEASAPVLASGVPGRADPQFEIALPMPPVFDVEVVAPGDVVTLGPIALTMHPTGGHTPGGTTWAWRSCEAGRCLDIVYADSQTPISQDGFRFSDSADYPNAVADFERGHALLEKLSCDVLITPHPGASGFWERVRTAPDGLIDREACGRFAAAARRQLQDRLDRERR